MAAGLRALLRDVIDYAGLFPPARLDFDVAVRNYARFQNEPQSWMLARFICPARRLCDLRPYLDELFSEQTPLRLSVLGRGGNTLDGFLDGIRQDHLDLLDFVADDDPRVAMEAFEVRLPGGLMTDADVMRSVTESVSVWGGRQARFFEPAADSDWRTCWSAIVGGLSRQGVSVGARSEANGFPSLGFKLRCGGEVAIAYPSIEQVATAIRWTHERGVPIKFTAGLHDPLRHDVERLRVVAHGFINVFAACALTGVDGVTQRDIQEVLASTDPSSFDFTDEGLTWRGFHIPCDAIARARRTFALSFGSCSFDEPRDGLRKLGWL